MEEFDPFADPRDLRPVRVVDDDDLAPPPARPAGDPLLDDLTPAQQRAVLVVDGPVLVLAGPGSGKTRVITRRIAHLIRTGVKPWRILALTFTNKAAGEMRSRVADLLGGPEAAAMRGLTITTFHSLSVRLLRRYCELAGFAEQGLIKPDFTIYDADDQAKLIKRVIAEIDLSTTNFPPRSVLSAISAAKNDLLDEREYQTRATDFYSRTIARCYTAYQHALRKAGACDFDDLLVLMARMLRQSPRVRGELRQRFRSILIDEYQDTNRAQLVIASLLAGGTRVPDPLMLNGDGDAAGSGNICAVGDPDQSIYGWRGADISNILDFEKQFPSAQVIALGENFRSKAPILRCADRLITKNIRRKHKPLIPTLGEGEKVEIVLCRDEHHEARLVRDWIKRLKEAGASWKDFAVFYRTNALSRVIEDELRTNAVPYTLVRGTAFFDREEIKNALAYLRVIANQQDDVSVSRIINTPARGISDTTLKHCSGIASERGVSIMQVLRDRMGIEDLAPRALGSIDKFLAMIDAWSGDSRPSSEDFLGASIHRGEQVASLTLLVERVIRESGLEAMYRSPGEEERMENLAELVSSAKDFTDSYIADAEIDPETGEAILDEQGLAAGEKLSLTDQLRAYLERIALVADSDAIDASQGTVTLMTLHAAKGLEYPNVAMLGLEEGTLPHMRAILSPDPAESQMEEERRLCFVGVTRAMKRLMMTSAGFRTVRGLAERTIPSRFLQELGTEDATVSDQSDPLGGWDNQGGSMEDAASSSSSSNSWSGGGKAPKDSTSPAPRSRGKSLSEQQDNTPSLASSNRNTEWAAGTQVRHPQFGLGEVKSYIPGATPRVTVAFKGVGTKTLVLEYARLTRV